MQVHGLTSVGSWGSLPFEFGGGGLCGVIIIRVGAVTHLPLHPPPSWSHPYKLCLARTVGSDHFKSIIIIMSLLLVLLLQIRAKEASRAVACITRDAAKDRQLEMLNRCPDVVRILRGHFITEQKAAIPWDDVVKKVAESLSSLSASKQTLVRLP